MSLARRSLPHTANELISCAFFIIRDVIMFILMLSLFSFVFCLDHVFFFYCWVLCFGVISFLLFLFRGLWKTVKYGWENRRLATPRSGSRNNRCGYYGAACYYLVVCHHLLLPSLFYYYYIFIFACLSLSVILSFVPSLHLLISHFLSHVFFPLCLYVNGYGQTDRISGG